jgi:hypothetical protein
MRNFDKDFMFSPKDRFCVVTTGGVESLSAFSLAFAFRGEIFSFSCVSVEVKHQ